VGELVLGMQERGGEDLQRPVFDRGELQANDILDESARDQTSRRREEHRVDGNHFCAGRTAK
jgi:hypothetical protein